MNPLTQPSPLGGEGKGEGEFLKLLSKFGKMYSKAKTCIFLVVSSMTIFVFTGCGFIGDLFGKDDEKIDVKKNEIIDTGTYYIDKYEASRPDATSSSAGSDNSRACSVAGVLPWVNINWSDAKAACKARGKGWGLCSGGRWEDTCDRTPGRGGYSYPYGKKYQESTCNGYDAGRGKTVPTGYMIDCTSKDGVYDMSGNVWEWVDEKWGDFRVIRGGSWQSMRNSLKCTSKRGVPPTDEDKSLGFRCCKNK